MMKRVPYIENIWRAKGSLLLEEPLTPEETFARLDPLFQTDGTQYAIEGDALAYAKRNPVAQDKLATFTSGTLQVQQREGASRIVFDVSSTALLLAFLAPLLFLGFAQVFVLFNDWENSKVEISERETGDKADDKKAKKKIELHPIDKMLGAPAPKDPDADKDKDKAESKEKKEKFSPTRAYVLAGLFVLIYLVGRVLEPWLLKRTFQRFLAAPETTPDSADGFGSPSAPPETAQAETRNNSI